MSSLLPELLGDFVLGLLSSAHCVGMCGGLAVTLGTGGNTFARQFVRQLIYSGGRLTTYAFLGATAGFAGFALGRSDNALIDVQRWFSVLAGALMILIGASVLGLLPFRVSSKGTLGEWFASLFAGFLRAPRYHGAFLAGLANGFLPCGLVYAFLARAVATGGMDRGALVMIAFGLGTVPAMVSMGCGGMLLGRTVRHRILQTAAALVMVMGVVTIARGWTTPQSDGSCPLHPARASALADPPVS
ncbi:MAG: sulfite exporter TauE/SafE family protein [Planctomycetota bacterium]|nr:MAG: sulfite exporter TauE/SafE family protein [Planctomycetota bacterium]